MRIILWGMIPVLNLDKKDSLISLRKFTSPNRTSSLVSHYSEDENLKLTYAKTTLHEDTPHCMRIHHIA